MPPWGPGASPIRERRKPIADHSNHSRLSALPARKAARSLLAIVKAGRPWTLADAQRCLPLGWRLGENFAAVGNQPMTVAALTAAFRQFASKI